MAMQEQAQARLYTVEEIAELLAVPKSWVYSHVASGDLPHVKVGRYVRFYRRQVLAYIEEGNRGR